MYPGCRGDVDDGAWFAVGDAEEGSSFADEAEGGSVVEGEDVVPLFVCHFVDYAVPCVAVDFINLQNCGWEVGPDSPSVVNDDMYFAIAELRCLFDQGLDIFCI